MTVKIPSKLKKRKKIPFVALESYRREALRILAASMRHVLTTFASKVAPNLKVKKSLKDQGLVRAVSSDTLKALRKENALTVALLLKGKLTPLEMNLQRRLAKADLGLIQENRKLARAEQHFLQKSKVTTPEYRAALQKVASTHERLNIETRRCDKIRAELEQFNQLSAEEVVNVLEKIK